MYAFCGREPDGGFEDEQVAEAKAVSHEAKEAVGDKGYHSNETCLFTEISDLRIYFDEPDRGTRDWEWKVSAIRKPRHLEAYSGSHTPVFGLFTVSYWLIFLVSAGIDDFYHVS